MSQVPLRIDIEMSVWAQPAAGDSLADLIRKLEQAGNAILAVDEVGDRVLVGYRKG